MTLGGGGNVTLGAGGVVTLGGGGNITLGAGGNITLGGGGNVTLGGGGVTSTELDYDSANSIVRPPPSADLNDRARSGSSSTGLRLPSVWYRHTPSLAAS